MYLSSAIRLSITSLLFSFIITTTNGQTYLVPTRSKHPKGTFLILPGEGLHRSLELTGSIKTVTRVLDTLGYNTAVLHYRISSHNQAKEDARKALQLLKTKTIQGGRLGIIGFASGSQLAA